MKRMLLAVAAGLGFSLVLANGAWALSPKDVANLHKDGVADSLIIQKITYSGQVFELDARDIRDLKKAGVSDDVISVMLRTESQGEGYGDQRDERENVDKNGREDTSNDGGGTSPHVSIGLGFGYYSGYGPYYGGYSPYCGYYGGGYYGGGYYGGYYPYYYRGYYAPRYRGYSGYAGSGYGYTRARYSSYGRSYGNTRPRYNYYGGTRTRSTVVHGSSYGHRGGGGSARHR